MIRRVKAAAPSAPLTQGIEAGYFAADQFIAALKKTGHNLDGRELPKGRQLHDVPDQGHRRTHERPGPTIPTSCGTTVTSDGTPWNVAYGYLCTHAVHFARMTPANVVPVAPGNLRGRGDNGTLALARPRSDPFSARCTLNLEA